MPKTQAQLAAEQNKKRNVVPAIPTASPEPNPLFTGIQAVQLAGALSGAPTVPSTTPPLAPSTGYQSPVDLAVATQTTGLPIEPTPVINPPVTTLTPLPAKENTIMGMAPEQFAVIAGMLGGALAPNEFGPTGQLVPSALGNVGNLAGAWGLAQMMQKQKGAPRTVQEVK